MSPSSRIIVGLFALAAAFISAGCNALGFGPMVQPVEPYSLRELVLENKRIRFFDARTSEMLYTLDVFERTGDADVVLFGELHGHPVGLPVAAAIWKDMLSVRDRDETPALLLEFFERDQQLAIDEYLAGMIDEEDFVKKSGRSASNFPNAHQAMFNATKKAGGTVIAANAPRRYVRLARTDGYDRLRAMTPAQRAMFELPPTEDGPEAYRERFNEIMGGMRSSDESGKAQPGMGVPDFLRAQLVWDATMADSVADALRAGHEPVALVIGRFHVAFDGATVEYLKRQRPGADVLTIVMVDRWSDELADEDRRSGDIVVYVGPADASGGDS